MVSSLRMKIRAKQLYLQKLLKNVNRSKPVLLLQIRYRMQIKHSLLLKMLLPGQQVEMLGELFRDCCSQKEILVVRAIKLTDKDNPNKWVTIIFILGC